MEYKDPVGVQKLFDVELMVGVLGWDGADDLIQAVMTSDIQQKDKWIISRAVEVGYEAGLNHAVS